MALLAAGCGGGEDVSKARVRFVNASTYSALTLKVGDDTPASSVAYGADTGYQNVEPGSRTADVSSPGSATILSSASVSLSKDRDYTLLAYGKAGALAQVLLDDEIGTPSSGKALVRVINAAADAGSVDVYLTGASEALGSATALQSGAVYGTMNGFVTINSGDWRLRVTAAGSKTDVRLDVANLNFDSESVRTLVITPSRGGVLVNALVVRQGGGLDNAANTQARVRVVAGAGGSQPVVASVGGTALLAGDTAPARTAYTTLAAGTVAVAASAGSSTAALTSATLQGGGDYTLLVWGASGSAQAAMLEDDNSRPSDSARARMRLVNGVAGASGTLSLKVEFLVTVSGVAAGTASSYADLAAASTPQLDVSAAGSSSTLCSVANKDVSANGVYTLFALGDATATSCVLSTDR